MVRRRRWEDMEYEDEYDNTEAEDAVEGVIRDLPMILGGIVILSLLYAGYNLFNSQAGKDLSDAFGAAMSFAAEILNHPMKYLIIYLVAQLLYGIGPYLLLAALDSASFADDLKQSLRERYFGTQAAREALTRIDEIRKGGMTYYDSKGNPVDGKAAIDLTKAEAKYNKVLWSKVKVKDGDLVIGQGDDAIKVKFDAKLGLVPDLPDPKEDKLGPDAQKRFDAVKDKLDKASSAWNDAARRANWEGGYDTSGKREMPEFKSR